MHYCPECDSPCYCHGDIDDCVVENVRYSAARCTHPLTEDCDSGRDYNPEYGDSPLEDEEESADER